MTADRDPRINPMPGDSLTCGVFTVTILCRIQRLLTVTYDAPQTEKTERHQVWSVGEWQQACKNEAAVVRKRGEP